MSKKAKIIREIKIAVCVFLAVALTVIGILFFPLTGEKHTEIWSADQQFDIAKIQTIEKEREDFKILMFTDTQLWSSLGKNKECYEQMDALVDKTQPDLITLPGDILSAMSSRFSINNFIKHMESYGIPWAPVYGNHDNEIPSNTLNWQADKYMAAEHCLMQKGPSNLYGCGNYVINITEKGELYTLCLCLITADILSILMKKQMNLIQKKSIWAMSRLPGMNGMLKELKKQQAEPFRL